ncbi:NACHT domain-containing protein [Ktedonobacter robiniae]|uniref:NACHT domain-containing protein n=1 Tax=Ktedonobacter robiniae TaxID=2778365 RepID=A0ABQ3V610_9CHLR|nr:hypothetical protein [Ktedonobacter robiniae]GHO60315.1 hypothetical protein KSB_87900 [Ktedonobacter robiniae]
MHLVSQPGAVFNPLSLAVREPHLPEQPREDGTSIIDVYFKAHQELCILGEPGVGKSTQLYILDKHLLQRAETDQQAPIPIIFWLSEWTINQHSLVLWMIEQLIKRYGISRSFAQQLVMEHQIIPLLDGLNEMLEEARSQCIAAINTYLEHPYPLVICSTSNEYAAVSQTSPLHLKLAVVLKPLTDSDITSILARGSSLTLLNSGINLTIRELQSAGFSPYASCHVSFSWHTIEEHASQPGTRKRERSQPGQVRPGKKTDQGNVPSQALSLIS